MINFLGPDVLVSGRSYMEISQPLDFFLAYYTAQGLKVGIYFQSGWIFQQKKSYFATWKKSPKEDLPKPPKIMS